MRNSLDQASSQAWSETLGYIDDPLGPFERNLHGHPLAKTAMGEKIGRILIARRLGGSTQLRMSFFSSTSSALPIDIRRRHQNDPTQMKLSDYVAKMKEQD